MNQYLYIGIAAVIAVLVICIICFYNKIIKLKNYVEEAFSTMDVYLKKRADLVPNLVETVKGYAGHEKEVFANAGKAISSWNGNEKNRNIRFQQEEEIGKAVRDIRVVTEAYPQLRANENFLMLQRSLQMLENDIADARKYYNGVVNTYNSAIQTFPANLFALILGFKKEQLFKASEGEREPVRVSF